MRAAAALRASSRLAPLLQRSIAFRLPRVGGRVVRAQSNLAFDSGLKALHKRAAIVAPYDGDASQYEYLRDEMASRLVERLSDIQRTFPVAVDLGANTGNILRAMLKQAKDNADEDGAKTSPAPGGIKTLHLLEPCQERLEVACKDVVGSAHEFMGVEVRTSQIPAEAVPLPFEDNSVDIVLSSQFLHWCNDLPAVLNEVKRVLKPDGVFLGCLMGGENSLSELRSSFVLAQTEREGGVSPHVGPFAGVADVGNLLSASGFGIPTVDLESVRCEYPSLFRLAEHLQGMGENNAALSRKAGGLGGFNTLLAAASVYQCLYHPQAATLLERALEEAKTGEEGSRAESSKGSFDALPIPAPEKLAEEGISATFESVFFIAWKPAPSQPKALRRGSVKKGFAAKGKEGGGGGGGDDDGVVGTALPPQ